MDPMAMQAEMGKVEDPMLQTRWCIAPDGANGRHISSSYCWGDQQR